MTGERNLRDAAGMATDEVRADRIRQADGASASPTELAALPRVDARMGAQDPAFVGFLFTPRRLWSRLPTRRVP
jgi:hypothetical protein